MTKDGALTRAASAEAVNQAVIAATFKIPEFYTHSPEVWFSFVEQQFLLRGVEDDKTKFAYVVTNLHPDVSALVRDVIAPPPDTDRYEKIKARLLKEFTLTDSERASQLLELPGLGDQRPSQLLSKMLALVPPSEQSNPGFLFKELFVRQLPPEVRHSIMDKYDMAVRPLAEEADRYFTISGARIAAVRAPPGRSAASASGPASGSSGNASGARRRGGNTMCFYHARYGDRAHKCESPCSYWPGN